MSRTITRDENGKTIEYDDSLPRKIDRKDSQPKLITQVRIAEVARHIAQDGWTYAECVDWIQATFHLKKTQADSYYYKACHSLLPDDPEEYRRVFIERNLTTLEKMLKQALEDHNLKEANNIIRTINSMLGVGSGKQVEIKDKDSNGYDKVITISFGE